MNREYNKLVMVCRDHNLDFSIPCGAKEHKQFILNLMDCPARIVVDKVEYYIGKKYQCLAYNLTKRKGKANFYSKSMYRAIKNIMAEFS